jgi:hypothetical protein
MRALPVLFALSMVACGGAGKVAETVRPDAPTYAQASGAGGGECRAVTDNGEPMIVDWRPEQRLDLEVAMKDGVAVVAYDCKTIKVLRDCRVDGTYGFTGTTTKEQVIKLENADEIRANLPLSGLSLAGKLEGELQRGSTLDVGLVMIGKKRTTWTSVPRDELKGDCGGATHFVRGATVGAFVMSTGTRAKVSTAVELFGAGGSGGSSSSKSVRNQDGSLDDCKKGSPDLPAPPSQCGALLRLDLVAFGAKKTPEDAPADCPKGLVLVGGKCTQPSADKPHVCAVNDLQDCTQQCKKGDAESCSRVGDMHFTGNAAVKDDARAADYYEKACEAGVPRACSNLGSLIEKGQGRPRDPARAFALLKKACDDGNPGGCTNLGAAYENGTGTEKDSAKAFAYFKAGCNGGYAQACFGQGLLTRKGHGTDKDEAGAAPLFKRACDGGDARGCVNLGVMHEDGKVVPKDLGKAFYLARRACDLGSKEGCYNYAECFEMGWGTARDRNRAVSIYKTACKEGLKEACAKLRELGVRE